MRAVVVSIVFVTALAAWSASIVGSAAASHRGSGYASGNAAFPSWSPDGKQILFTYVGATRTRIVRTSSRPSGAIRTIHTGPHGKHPYAVLWAPGGRIVFRHGINWYSVGVHGGKAKPITFPSCGSTCWPDTCLACSLRTWSLSTPNREYAAITTNSGADNPPPPESIALLKLKPGHAPVEIHTPLNTEEQDGAVSDSIVSFSPNGKQLIFMRDGLGLMAYRLGSSHAPVSLAQSGLPGASLVPSDARGVQWSPDGHWVAFAENQSLEVVATNGATPPRVLPSCLARAPEELLWGFSWSPTSNLIAYDCVSNLKLDGAELMTVRPDGTHLTDPLNHRPLTYVNNFSGLPEPLQWSPDGSRLLFLAHAGAPTAHVYTIRPNGDDLVRLG